MADMRRATFRKRLVLLAIILSLFAYAAWQSYSFARVSRQLPLGVAVVGSVLVLVALGRALWRYLGGGEQAVSSMDLVDSAPPPVSDTVLWFSGLALYMAGIVVVGYVIATAVFIGFVLLIVDKSPLWVVVVSLAVVMAAVMAWATAFGIDVP